MSGKDQIKAELDTLVEDARKLLSLVQKSSDHMTFSRQYQAWYTKTIKVFSVLAPDRLVEFREYYQIDPRRKSINPATYKIQDYMKGIAPANAYGKPPYDIQDLTQLNLWNQFHILQSISSRIEGVLADIEGSLIAGFQDTELSTANNLKRVSFRAAGALAGVVLEGHLQRVALNHNIVITKKNPTIGDLNDPLKQAEIYDQVAWRKIQYMGDIRNICSHKKNQEPTSEQIDELINGVNWVIKNIM